MVTTGKGKNSQSELISYKKYIYTVLMLFNLQSNLNFLQS